MGRKKGDQNADTILKAQEALAMKLEQDKTQAEIAEELGVAETTVARRLQVAMAASEVQNIVTTSRNRLLQMLGRCDEAYHDILSHKGPENFANRAKVATSIYKTFGLIQDDAQLKIQNIIPIQITIQDPNGEKSYTVGPAKEDQ